jgi:hypothetical protein
VKFAVPVADQEPKPVCLVTEVMSRLRACWVTQARWGGP